MRQVERALFIFCFITSILGHPGVAGAEGERGGSSFAMDSSQESGATPVQQARGGERFAVGVILGLSLSQFIGKDTTSEIAEYTQKSDMTFGISGATRLQEWLSIRSDVLFVSKGRLTNLNGALFSTLDANYIEIPLLARIDIPVSERVTPYLLAGPALGILLKYQNRVESDGSVTDRSDEVKRLDLSGIVGAGVKMALTQQHGLTLEGRYDRSFTRFLKTEEDAKHSAFAFVLGYQYSFSSASP